MVPLTAFTTSGIVTQATGGRVALTSVITLLAMVVTARQSFGGATGFLVSWSLLLDYLFLPIIARPEVRGSR